MKNPIVVHALSLVLFAALVSVATAPSSFGQVAVGITVAFAPPDLPVYEQPPCPGANYIWVPGYWAWDIDGDDYFWVPATWVFAPEPGFFWTPGYWAWSDGGYVFNAGYWGPAVGFYGGINYGFGYFGSGYVGGRWRDGHFFYNTAVTNVNVTVVHQTYVDQTVVVNRSNVTRVSFNGGNGGINARPTPQEEAAARERRVAPVQAQIRNRDAARTNREFRASVNHGLPSVAATPKPAEFQGKEVVAASKAGAVHAPEGGRAPTNAPREDNAARPAVHAKELPPVQLLPPPNTGNPELDQKYEKQQQQLAAKQEKERQKLEQQQQKEHEKVERQQASEQARQQMEQHHQQQTQQMEQHHEQQRQEMQRRQQPPPHPSSPPQDSSHSKHP